MEGPVSSLRRKLRDCVVEGDEVRTALRAYSLGLTEGYEEAWEYAHEYLKDHQHLAELPYEQYLQTPHWQLLRRLAKEAAGYRCQVCNGQGVLDVHHRTYERRGRERLSDLTVLCRDCHSGHHRK